MSTATLQVHPSPSARLKRTILFVVVISIGLHVIAGIIAGVVIVARYFTAPPPEFVVKKDIRLPAKQRQHKMNMAAFDAMTPKPSFNDKMQSLRPTAFALPELPKVPMDQMLPLDPSALVSDQVSGLVGTAGLGAGGDGVGGLGGTGKGMSFFGIESGGRRVLLLFDVSSSVLNKASKTGVPLSRIREETLALINKLPINSRFGLIQFTQNYKAFNTQLLPSTDKNREEARLWLEQEWVETGMMNASAKVVRNPRGIMGVLELAAQMQPDAIFLISDGSFQWKVTGSMGNVPWKDVAAQIEGGLQEAQPCTVNFIGFGMKPEDKKEISAIVRKSGGKVREMQ